MISQTTAEDLISLVEYTESFKSLNIFLDKSEGRIKSPGVFRSTIEHIIGVYQQIKAKLVGDGQQIDERGELVFYDF